MALTRWLRRFALGLLIASQVAQLHAQGGLAADGWSGQVQCELRVQTPGYQDVQTQTWVLSGSAPIARNNFRDYPATWTVSGNGSRTPLPGVPGGGGSTDTWTRSGTDANAYLTIFEPVGTRNLRIAPGQIPVRASAGLAVTTEVRVPGGATTPISSSTADADEWRFPYLDAVPNGGTMSGSRTQVRAALVGWRQPAGAPVTETCAWSFTQGGAAPASALLSRTTVPSRVPGTLRGGTAVDSPAAGTSGTPTGAVPPVTVTAGTFDPALAIPPLATLPTSSPPTAPPAPPPAAPLTGPQASVDLFTYFVNQGNDSSTRFWPPNSFATYTVKALNSGSGAASGAVLTIRSSGGLSNAAVTCQASGGAQCPAGLTFAALGQGIAIPSLPTDSGVTIGIAAAVTGVPGSNVIMSTAIASPPSARDAYSNDNADTVTYVIASPSVDRGVNLTRTLPSGGARTVAPEVGRRDPSFSAATCTLPGPVTNPPEPHVAGVNLTWAHINGATYTLSRTDLGIVSPAPLTAALYPSTLAFWHSTPLYHHVTYEYVVVAQYGGGCGQSRISVVPPRPWVPNMRAELGIPIPAMGHHFVKISWAVDAERYGDNYGFMLLGPGYGEGEDWPWGCGRTDNRLGCQPWLWDDHVTAPPGTHTWIVAPYWETANGRMIDVSSGGRVTLTVPPVQ
jgi:hypothetical protein